MSAKIHAVISIIMSFTIVVGIVLLFVLGEDRVQELGPNCILIAIASFILWLLILSFLPARCNKPECNGRMRPCWAKGPNHEWMLQYKCDRCEEVYDAQITVEFGGPWPW